MQAPGLFEGESAEDKNEDAHGDCDRGRDQEEHRRGNDNVYQNDCETEVPEKELLRLKDLLDLSEGLGESVLDIPHAPNPNPGILLRRRRRVWLGSHSIARAPAAAAWA
jgi:hypothetical protein